MQLPSAGHSLSSTAKRFAIAMVSLSAVGLAGTYLMRLVPIWPCALVEHFAVQMAFGGIAVTALAAAMRLRGYFDVAVVATLLHALPVVRDQVAEHRVVPTGTNVRVLVLNVHTSSTSYAAVRRLIDDVQPDVLGLVEVDQHWLDKLAPSTSRFVGKIEHPQDDNFGVALYAREAFEGSIEWLGSALPTAVANVSVEGTRLSVILTHPIPPVSSEQLAAQERQLAAVADRVHELGGPVVVMGDLNATPWSSPFRDFVARSGLCDSRAGFGLQTSFPASSTILRIPIDHVLTSCNVGIADRRIERDVGSDHLPVVVELVVSRE
ncbi:MAG: endonuclease/exonuclease/phosphatase family protein [Kofleriaceae bacterium]|nr:endonuclease/exonuclease/phosphatase family protein [Kofleriaceae bacterium]